MREKFKKYFFEWLKVLEFFLLLYILPTSLFYLISLRWHFILEISYKAIVFIFMFQAGLSYFYTFRAFKRRRFTQRPPGSGQPIPKTTFIVSAYLPNEIKVIEDTLLNILTAVWRPQAGIELILCYNTPRMDDLELKLRDYALKYPELILANAHGSRSKGENLNHAIDIMSGKIAVLLDADHMVAADCLSRAWRWLESGYDIVQGRCKVRNGSMSFITRLVEAEFEVMYGISHTARSLVYDAAIFGGSNGYWRSECLRAIRFSASLLTEDIDATLRALLAGYRIVHDRSIVSTELAPVTLGGLWFQRKRWGQGWFQCSIKYQIPLLVSRYTNAAQKFLWITLLSWRVAYDVISQLLFPVLFAFWLYRGAVVLPMSGYIWFALIFTFFSGPFEAVAAYKNSSLPKPPLINFLIYALCAFFYSIFKTIIHLISVRDELIGQREWVVTERKV